MTDIDEALSRGDLDGLLGMAESEVLEVKSEPYDLGTPEGRYELAKDVSALANSNGGHLVIGITTAREQTRNLDILTELRLLQAGDCSRSQYLGVVGEYVYPRPNGLDAEFILDCSGSGGVFVVRVPQQHPDQKPFLIARVVEEGNHLKQIVVGYAQRLGDSAEPLAPSDLHRRFKQGMDSIAQRLTRIEERLDAAFDAKSAGTSQVADVDLLDRRMRDILNDG